MAIKNMPVQYLLKHFSDSNIPAWDSHVIFVFESDNEKLKGYTTRYDVNDINKMLESPNWQDHFVKQLLIEKMIELQNTDRSKRPDLEQSYDLLLRGLSSEAMANIRRLKYHGALGDPVNQNDRDAFIQQFLFDWANTKPEDILKGPHPGGIEKHP